MAYVKWTESSYPSNTNYDSATYIAWLSGFFTRFNDAMVQVGMEFINTTFDPETFTLPAMMTSASVSGYSNIATFTYKFPQGSGETVFSLNESGDYYDIISNDHDNSECYLKITFCFAKSCANVSSTNRYQREQLYAYVQHGKTLSESNTNNFIHHGLLCPQKLYNPNTTAVNYSGYLMFNDLDCHVSLTENELHVQIFSGLYMNSRGTSFGVPPPVCLLEIHTYRENNNIVSLGHTSLNTSNVSGNNLKYNPTMGIYDLSFDNSIYTYNITKFMDDMSITQYDNYGNLVTIQIDAPIRNNSIENGYIQLPNIIITHASNIDDYDRGFDAIVNYKGHPVKRTFYPPKNLLWHSMAVSSNHSANSSIATFAYYRG